MTTQVRVEQRRTVVVGSGVAGLACALALAPTPVTLITKTALPASGSSPLAQGGIAAALGPLDSPDQHAADTLLAGGGLAERDRVSRLAHDGRQAVEALIAAGLPADREADGRLSLGREAAHSRPRIVHAGGDATGRELVATLLAMAAKTPSIEVLTEAVAVDLLTDNGRIAGLLAYRSDRGWIAFASPAVVLATGGVGALWRETTNPDAATADGLAMAARAGARLADLEFVQFHPTALLPRDDRSGARLPLLTEALRGAGARLIDQRGAAVMDGEHALGDLAPRDAVARAIWRRRSAGEAVFLDLRPALARHGEGAFPQAVALCRTAGYEPASTAVPVTPAAHYHMGGVLTDADGATSIPGLWACGEVANTGVHGANRLASNSLLEGLVFGRRVADGVRRAARARPDAPLPQAAPPVLRTTGKRDLGALRERLRTVMSRHAGIVRHGAGLSEALATLERLQEAFEADGVPAGPEAPRRWSELRNMLLAGRLIVLAARRRRESRGAHARRDFPGTRADWAQHQVLTLQDLSGVEPTALSPSLPSAHTH